LKRREVLKIKRVKKHRFILVASVVFFVLIGYAIGIAKTEDEENNISIYRRVAPGVVNITSVVVERGAMIAEVVARGPADRAGLRGGDKLVQVGNSLIPVGGDVITEMDGKKVTSSDELIRMIRDHRPGDRVELKVLRKGKFLHIKMTLGEKPR
jgi:S1-C subfamily serine protease